MIFLDYDVVDVPQTNTDTAILYTTTYKCMVYFEPDGTGMESDEAVGVYVNDYYIDTDGGQFDPFIFFARDSSSFAGYNGSMAHARFQSSTHAQGTLQSMIVPSGKTIRAYIEDSTDRIKGKLHIFRLPEAE